MHKSSQYGLLPYMNEDAPTVASCALFMPELVVTFTWTRCVSPFYRTERKTMKYKYHRALLEAGYDQQSKMYKDICQVFDRDSKKNRYELEVRRKLGITLNRLSAFEGEDGSAFDFIASDEDVEESVLNKIEMDAFIECLNELSKDDREFLLVLYSGQRGALAEMERTLGISHNTLIYRRKKLQNILRQKMRERNY